MKKSNAYTKIHKAMIANERTVLAHIRKMNKNLGGYDPIISSHSWYNALDRLVAKGRIKFHRSSGKRTGYWIVLKGKK